MTENEEFPFNNQYYDLVKGKTLSKRGKWWTALLIVLPKTRVSDENSSNVKNTKAPPQKKVIIQRWQRWKQEESFSWRRSKDFTISSKKQWLEMREILDKWVEDKSWE